MKGIILAGGNGACLYPMTNSISKQLLAVYNKSMIYYLLSGIKEILLILTPADITKFRELFFDGSGLGISVSCTEQEKSNAFIEAFILFFQKVTITFFLWGNNAK